MSDEKNTASGLEQTNSPDTKQDSAAQSKLRRVRLNRGRRWTWARRVTGLVPASWPRTRGFKLGVGLIVLCYAAAWGADFLAPTDYLRQDRQETSAPPTVWHWRDASGGWHLRPFIYRRQLTDALTRTYSEDTTRRYALGGFVAGTPYKFLGFIPTRRRLLGVLPENSANVPQTPDTQAFTGDAPQLHLLGTDALGRDRWARLLRAARFSLIVGPAGAIGATLLGILLGGWAGYGSARWDNLIMRAADTVLALPTLVLVLAARAAFPLQMSATSVGLLLISIFVAIGWGETARLVRGLVWELRQRDFVLAARTLGLSEQRILWRHIRPNLLRPCVLQFTVILPSFLLAETALSYFGLSVPEPEPSWGQMLSEAANLPLLAAQPLIVLSPAIMLCLFVLGVRLVSDALARQRR